MVAVSSNGKPLSFQIKFVKKSTSEVREIRQAVLCGSNWKAQTRTLENRQNEELRECCIRLILEFNHEPVRY